MKETKTAQYDFDIKEWLEATKAERASDRIAAKLMLDYVNSAEYGYPSHGIPPSSEAKNVVEWAKNTAELQILDQMAAQHMFQMLRERGEGPLADRSP